MNGISNRFEMQDHEKEMSFGLNMVNFGARIYNPTIGRWGAVDLMTEKWDSYSPYVSMVNDPINFIDPDGNDPLEGISSYTTSNGTTVYYDVNTLKNVAYDYGESTTEEEPKPKKEKEVSDRQFAAGLPVNIAVGVGAYSGLKQTGGFFLSLFTSEGWEDLGTGFVNLARMSNQFDPRGIMMKADIAAATDGYINNVPNMTPGEVGHDLGLLGEKVGEALLTRKVLPVSKVSLGYRVLGQASKSTTRATIDLQGKLGKLPFRVPTPIAKNLGVKSKDVGTVLTRNVFIPVGRVIPFQYVQQKTKNKK